MSIRNRYVINGMLLFMLSGFLFTAWSCSTSKPIVQNKQNARLVLGEESLQGHIRIENPKVRSTGNFKQGAVMVRNLTNKEYHLEYKFDWMDSEGFELSQGSWKRFDLSPRQIREFSSTGRKEEATRFTFTVRPVHEDR